MGTVVIQSHRQPLPALWMNACCESVRCWADIQGYEYRFVADELFDAMPRALMEKTRAQPVVATDLARLQVLHAVLDAGAHRVVWVDADLMVLDPLRFVLKDADAQFGREVWVQRDHRGTLKVHRKIHNAFMAFRRGEPVLPFYRFAAQRILQRYRDDAGPMVPQLLGPKLLSLLHNAIGLEVLETAGALSPEVVLDVLAGGGPALKLFCEKSVAVPLALNLCASSVRDGLLSDSDLARLVRLLLEDPDSLAG